jgi:hypothetical protein
MVFPSHGRPTHLRFLGSSIIFPASSNTSSNRNGGAEMSIALLHSAVFEKALTCMQKKENVNIFMGKQKKVKCETKMHHCCVDVTYRWGVTLS